MAEIKLTITIEATLVRDAHQAIDAMDAALRAHGGRVVSGKIVPITTKLKNADWRNTNQEG